MNFINGIIKKFSGNEEPESSPEEAGLTPEETEPAQEPASPEEVPESKEDSGKKIIQAVDELLTRMQSRRFSSKLSPEEKSNIANDFQNIQLVIAGCHCDCDVSSLDENILHLVQTLDGQLEGSEYGEWKEVMSVLKRAVQDRISGEIQISLASLSIVETTLELTNRTIERKIEESKLLQDEADSETTKDDYQIRILTLKKDMQANKVRLEEIAQRRVWLKDKNSIPTKADMEKIDLELAEMLKALPDLTELLEYNIEAIREKAITQKVNNQKAREVLDRADEIPELTEMKEEIPEELKETDAQAETITE